VQTDRQPVFYFDLASPYACLAAFRLEAVLPVAPVWRPVWMGPILAAAGREWRRPAAEVRERHADIERRAAGYGMPPWRWPEKYAAGRELGVDVEPINTLDVMRLATLADGAGVGEEFARRAFHLAFGEGRDLTSVEDEVIAAAVACGLDADDARAAPDDPEIKLALRNATDAASARGVTGMPTVAIGDELFWGDDRLEDAAAALAPRSGPGP
jgi:2-hydroxychromene-2-carboxylate isomerase